MSDRRINIGTLTVSANRIRIGDANFPPVGTLIERVPNGDFAVEGLLAGPKDISHFAWFSICFGDDGTAAETTDFSIDGGIVAISDPNVHVPKRFWDRWRRKRQVYREIDTGFNNRPYTKTLIDEGRAWAVLLYSGDGIYKLSVDRKDDFVTRLRCNLK